MVLKVAIKKNLVGMPYYGGKLVLKSKESGESDFNVRALVFLTSVS